MKKSKFKILLFVVLIGGCGLLQNCSSDDGGTTTPPPVVVNTAALDAAITSAANSIANTTEGTAVGNYTVGSQDILQTAIGNAQTIVDNASSTQAQVDAALVSLNSAIDSYNAAVIEEIDPDNLVGHWKFDDGSGTTVADDSGNDFTGTFGAETMLDAAAANPVWTADRFGTADKALLFDKGSKVTVPYNAAINPPMMSISVWIRVDENRESNRFIGLHEWVGYKFQTQSADKAFFTSHTTEGTFDKDTDPPLVLGTWYHLVVTVGDGNTTFFINGAQTQQWTDTPGTMFPDSTHDLTFGVGSSQYAAVDTDFDIDGIVPAAWGGYFHGAIDEIRIYKTILSPTQVTSIFNAEKP
ncbi:LamG-like jellyroll fold domain-containing protein [Ulvibacterium marinum]|uniref:LamG-like jellyroll fold domain-containing protein n=1 Tax=Ulvibacterium marinum TaxID=2419782 RepID=UPI0024953FC7|nr:LamG-like jellyroll fold domain-containing protein [Ulvibacterium marinum]